MLLPKKASPRESASPRARSLVFDAAHLDGETDTDNIVWETDVTQSKYANDRPAGFRYVKSRSSNSPIGLARPLP